MNYRILFLIHAIVAVLLGVGFLALPSRLLHGLGVDEYAATKLISQFFGAAMLALGLLLWFAKDMTDASLQKGMAIALLVASGAGSVISLLGTASGIVRSNGWMVVMLYVLLGLGYAYLVFLKPRVQPS